jgi:hypothetical protein
MLQPTKNFTRPRQIAISSGQPPQNSGKVKNKKTAESEFEQLVLKSISRTGVLEIGEVYESSGLALANQPNCYWTINDSGNPSDVFLFRQDGKELARLKIDNAKNRDWEALTRYDDGDRHWIVVADVGDNQRLQNRYRLYFFLDPTHADGEKPFEKKTKQLKSIRALTIEFSYADGQTNGLLSKDCEAVGVDPLTGDIWLTEKVYLNRDRKIKPGFYVIPAPKEQLRRFLAGHRSRFEPVGQSVKNSEPLVARRVGSFPIRNVTGMAFSPDANKLIIRNYLSAHLYIRPKNQTWKETIDKQVPTPVALPLQGQGEAICFTPDSNSVLVTSEGKRQPIWKIDLKAYLEKNTTH